MLHIDFSKEYIVKAVPSSDLKELKEKGIGVYPGTQHFICATWDDKLKRYRNTGFDEYSAEIMQEKDPVKRKELQEMIIKRREFVENWMARPGYLESNSDAWISDLCVVNLEVGQDLKVRINGRDDRLRPADSYKDYLTVALLMADPNFPKSKKDLTNSRFRDAKFYITTSEELEEITKKDFKTENKGHSLLYNLFEGKDKKKAKEIAFYLGLVNRDAVDSDILYKRLNEAIFNDKTKKTLHSFIEACELDQEVLYTHNIFKAACNLKVVGRTPDGFYHRGSTNYRKTTDESVQYLLSPGMELELAGLKEDVDKRRKKYKQV